MKTVEQWLDAYSASHQNPRNKLIHWICVPAILFSIIGMIWHFSLVLTLIAMVLSLVFYFRLSIPLTIAMAGIFGSSIILVQLLRSNLLPVCVGIFVVAWFFQFVGHKIEGKKPSFFEDLQFLLIGPLWCLAFLFRKLKITY